MEAELTSVTRTTFRVVDFLSWQRHGHLDLRPPFQRQSVWSKKAKSYLVDTIIRGYPVPLIFIQDQTDPETLEPRRQVVDGQQRLRTIISFVEPKSLGDFSDKDDFALLKAHRPSSTAARFEDLPPPMRQRILDYEFSVHVLPSGTPNNVLLEIFSRMNSTGVKLNDQELRNAEFHGEFKSVVYRLALSHLNDLLDWGIVSQTQAARMRDRELVSELFVLMSEGVTAKSKPKINDYYERFDDSYPQADEVARRFEAVMSVLRDVYGPPSTAEVGRGLSRSLRTQGWFYPMFAWVYRARFGDSPLDAIGARARRIDTGRLVRQLQVVGSILERGEVSEALLKSLRGAATDRASRAERLGFLDQQLA